MTRGSPRWHLVLWAVLLGCNGVGFHEDANIDFVRYRTAVVPPFSLSGDSTPVGPIPTGSEGYFVAELKRLSGFDSVQRGEGTADLSIQVDIARIAVETETPLGPDCCNTLDQLLSDQCTTSYTTVRVELAVLAVDSDGVIAYEVPDAVGDSNSIECADDWEIEEAYADALEGALDVAVFYFLDAFDL